MGVEPPPLPNVVNVTLVFEQIEPDGFALMEMEGVTAGVTVTAKFPEEAVFGTAQAELEVMVTLTLPEPTSAVVVKPELSVPALTPLICHW